MILKTATLLIGLSVITMTAFAQQPSNKTAQKDARPTVTKMQDGVIRKGGKTWYIKSITGTIQLSKGIEINSDGVLKIKNKAKKLTEGDCISYKGEVVILDKTNIKVDSFVMRKNNAVWVWHILTSPVQFTNGTTAMPNGTIKTANGKFTKIKDDEFINMDGNSVIKKEYSF